MKNYIKDLQEAYYAGKPRISNEEYDALVSRFGEDEIGTGGDFKHMFRMYSLDKVYPGRGDVFPLPKSKCVETPKLDGCAISLLYIEGLRTQGNTRGDGISSPTTFEAWKLDALGVTVMSGIDTPIMQITGEVVTTKRVDNERNYASGAMQLQDESEFRQRVEEGGLEFVAYNVQFSPSEIGITESYLEDMDILFEVGFNSVTTSNWGDVCPTDGIVYRLDSNKAFMGAGFTHKHPKGAFAVKEDEEAVWTRLIDVVWNTGRSGAVTPVALFGEVVIDGAKISRATLNNAGYIESMGIYEGCEVAVIRAGSIIPKIVDVR